MRLALIWLTACLACLSPLAASWGLEKPGEELSNVGVTFKNGDLVDGSLVFRDRFGRETRVGDMGGGLPLIVVPMYYGCPRLCGLVAGGVETMLGELGLTLGQDFRIASVSFDETETPEDADRAANAAYKRLGLEPSSRPGWEFYVGSGENIQRFMGQLGFGYQKDEGEFAHSAALILLTPQGEISQYFTGIEFLPRDLRLALVEASSGRIGSVLDHVLLYCFRFDPTLGKYTWAVFGILRVVGVLTLLGFLGLYMFLRRWQRVGYPRG